MQSNDHEAALAGLRAELDAIRHHGKALDGHEQWLSDHSRILTEYGQALDRMDKWVARLERAQAAYHDDHEHGEHRELRRRLDELELAQSARVFMDWIGHARLRTSPRISVIMPTYNRVAFLPAAIASVAAQTYANWELVVVDDACTDPTPEFLATVDDPRVRPVRVEHGGVCAARNAGLAAATGEIIAYLDDDNTMHPSWLKSVVWAFEQRPDVDVVYGGIVLDDAERVIRRGSGGLPRMFLRPYDREVLLRENLADISAIAHRAGLPAARFDESLVEMGDWDLLCGLTAERDPLMLPAIACFYATDAPNRLSGGATYDADYETVRRKHAPEGAQP
ncbi:MAG TPA: glycosyltransferase family A protein [Actinophytocola sp.]|uniref:glycosyltransferase family 2 protein n=1 Tax=Actinophytocola sp. TaxID=1872138 RepID=UPI002DDCD6D6|nr:glycosyltransferase family A protein [Actinophytocola sp.]HEV2781746.1 glycosyltransferase family A protein [Actinophytocola sp.]